MKRVTARDIYEGYGEGDDEGYEDVEYVLASEAKEEIDNLQYKIDELKNDIQEENNKLAIRAMNNLRELINTECAKIVQAYTLEFNELAAAKAEITAQRDDRDRYANQVDDLKVQLAAADNGLLKASDPKSGWQGISKECKLWQEKAEAATEREQVLVEVLEWYSEKAVAIQVYLSTKKYDATMAVLTELSLDAGRKARAALAQVKEE